MLLKRILTSYYNNVWNRRDYRLLGYLFADHCVVNYINKLESTSVRQTPYDIRKSIVMWVTIFPDLRVTIKNIISNKEYVSAHCQFTGRHTGKWMDIEPTDKSINIEIFTVFKVEGGKICEQWVQVDVDDVLDQILNANKKKLVYEA
jgi:predicted ester cyclase